MSRAPDQMAPSWLPRQRRRHVDRALRKLLHRNSCSLCGGSFKHNSPTASGFDAQGNVALAGECCIDRLSEIFLMGLYSDRKYDFLLPSDFKPDSEVTNKQAAAAIALYQKAIADADERFADVEKRGGVARVTAANVLDHPWMRDDRDWFKQNPTRSHRMRMPFPGELDGVKIPAGRTVIILVRQVAPGQRIRAVLDPDIILLPGSLDDEAAAHALFEVAMQREAMPTDCNALRALMEKYTARG